MKLSFLPGDLHLTKKQDGTYLVTMQGHEVLRTHVEKKALAKFNVLRRELELPRIAPTRGKFLRLSSTDSDPA